MKIQYGTILRDTTKQASQMSGIWGQLTRDKTTRLQYRLAQREVYSEVQPNNQTLQCMLLKCKTDKTFNGGETTNECLEIVSLPDK
jgi:hypothetical protein